MNIEVKSCLSYVVHKPAQLPINDGYLKLSLSACEHATIHIPWPNNVKRFTSNPKAERFIPRQMVSLSTLALGYKKI